MDCEAPSLGQRGGHQSDQQVESDPQHQTSDSSKIRCEAVLDQRDQVRPPSVPAGDQRQPPEAVPLRRRPRQVRLQQILQRKLQGPGLIHPSDQLQYQQEVIHLCQ